MSDAAVGTAERGETLYRAEFYPIFSVLQRIMLVVAGAGFFVPVTLLGVFVAIGMQSSWGIVAALGLALVGAALGGTFIALTWRSTSMAMVVTTTGIEVRGYWIRRWIPWEEIARIESSTHWYWRRATCIHTHHTLSANGERIIATVTAYQYIFWRNEPYDAQAHDPREHLVPTRVAIDAHRRYLRGKFSGDPALGQGVTR